MIELSLSEAQLLRILSEFFGKERVIPFMSVLAVCNGEIPDSFQSNGFDIRAWAKKSKCLFTIVDREDSPRAVFEFFSGFGDVIENDVVEHRQYLRPLLRQKGIHYITITNDEFSEILDPQGTLDFVSFLKDRMQVDEA